jgi:menaquinone-dependent protoporphyrinogen oxidase
MTERLHVLLAYASAAGSTAEIAERMATVLRGAGFEVSCRPVTSDLDPAAFDAVVLGSPVHNGRWLAAAREFAARTAGTLEARPLWCFSVGGVEPRGWYTRRLVSYEARQLQRALPAGLTPIEHRLFPGVVVMTGLPLRHRLGWLVFGGRAGDHRDWPAIEGWAGEVAAALPAHAVPRGNPS